MQRLVFSEWFSLVAALRLRSLGMIRLRILPFRTIDAVLKVTAGPKQTSQDALVGIAGRGDCGEQFGNVVGAAGFESDVDGGVPKVDAVMGAVVGGFHDVGTVFGEDAGQLVQRPRVISEMDAQADEASVFDHAALNDASQQRNVDVAPAHHDDDFFARNGQLTIDQGRGGGGSRAFGQGFFALQQQQDCVGDFLIVDGNDFVDIFLNHGQGPIASPADGNTVGDGGGSGEGNGFALGHSSFHRGQPGRLHSVDFDLGIAFLDGAGDAGDQPAAADGHDYGLDIGKLLENFKTDGSLAGDDGIVIEGMDEDEVIVLCALQGGFVGSVVISAVKNDVGSIAPGSGDFGQGSGKWHVDARANTALPGMVGKALGVVSSRSGDDALGALGRREGEQLVQRAAFLERAGFLAIIELKVDRAVGEAGEGLGARARREVDGVADAPFRRFHV